MKFGLLSLTGNVAAVLLVFALLTVLFHLLFNRFWRLTEPGAKLIDYWWLGVAALGLVATSGEARRIVAPYEAKNARIHATYALDQLRTSATASYHCQQFVETSYNAATLKESQRLEDAGCAWQKLIAASLPSDDKIEVLLDGPFNLPTITPPLSQDTEDLRDIFEAKRYADFALADYKTAIALGEHSDAENIFRAFAPFLLAAALALRITKVSVELRLFREKAAKDS